MKIAGALFAGTLAGVAALTTLTSGTSPQLSPVGDSTAVTSSVVESSAPCPAGTVEREDSCVKTVAVPVTAASTDDDADGPSAAPKPSDVSRPVPAAHSAEPAEPAEAPESDATNDDNDGEHDSDANEVEHEGEHADSDEAEHESDD
jgi:hypothetical protein